MWYYDIVERRTERQNYYVFHFLIFPQEDTIKTSDSAGVFFVAQCREMGYYESRFLGREEKKDEIFL